MDEDKTQAGSERGQTERIWQSTRKGLHEAASLATRYKRIVQKKIDLAAVHKKIGTAYADLGRTVDTLHEQGSENILGNEQIHSLFEHLDTLKQAAANLEHDIENIKNESSGEKPAAPPGEEPPAGQG